MQTHLTKSYDKESKEQAEKKSRSNIKELESELNDVKLENRILKELLKKVTNFGSKIRS